MKIFLYVIVLSALLTFLPQYLHAPLLILNGLIISFSLIKQSNNKSGVANVILMVIAVIVVYPDLLLRVLGFER